MKKKIFIDGRAGTTGLRIYERLEKRDDIELIILSEEERKGVTARKKALNDADVAFLCLPDDAARESVSLIENDKTVVIDTSTAHRTLEGWVYGFPEISETIAKVLPKAKRIAVPGCHASGFISLVHPLIEKGIIPPDAYLTCHSITGYSGGGKKMISEYEDESRDALLDAPRQYALGQTHKHLREMKAITGLAHEPIFCPIVSDFYSGMTVTVPIFASQLNAGYTVEDVKEAYAERYTGGIVEYIQTADESGLVSGAKCSGLDSMKISVAGNEDRILLIAMYDNLGKGASGAAVDCLNFVLGVDKNIGLEI